MLMVHVFPGHGGVDRAGLIAPALNVLTGSGHCAIDTQKISQHILVLMKMTLPAGDGYFTGEVLFA